MILLLLLAVTSLASGSEVTSTVKSPPLYVESHREIQQSILILKDNILSMDGNIPYLNDSRRSYAEITHVIYILAMELGHSCYVLDYDADYQSMVDVALPWALAKPQDVVKVAKKLISTYNKKTHKIQKLVHDVERVPDVIVANQLVDVVVTSDPKNYKSEAEILLSAGVSAAKFNEMKDIFHDVAKTMLSHRYIIKGSKNLKEVIAPLINTLLLIYPDFAPC